MKRIYNFKKLQLGLLFVFVAMCLISTIILNDSVTSQLTNQILESKDTTFLYYIMFQVISDGVNQVPIFPQIILAIKFFAVWGFVMTCLYSLIKLRGYQNVIDWMYLAISGFVLAIHFVSFENGSQVVVFLRKLYVAYFLGVTTFPLIIYYLVVLQLVVIMIGLLLFELRLIKSRNMMLGKRI